MQLPLQRYFLFAGGALLILLFATDWVASPLKGEHVKSEVRLPVIRIHSERKGPEAVVFDTTQPTFVAPVEQVGAATPRAVASTETSATEAIVQLSGLMPESAEPAKPSNPKTKHREFSALTPPRRTGRSIIQHRSRRATRCLQLPKAACAKRSRWRLLSRKYRLHTHPTTSNARSRIKENEQQSVCDNDIDGGSRSPGVTADIPEPAGVARITAHPATRRR